MSTNPTPANHARTTGLLYAALFVFGLFAPVVLQTVLVPGDAAATGANLASSFGLFSASVVAWFVIVLLDLLLAVYLYLVLRDASPVGALAVGALRLVYTAMLGANLVHLATAHAVASGASPGSAEAQALALGALEAFSTGFSVAIVVFGMHVVALGAVVLRSGAMPRWLGVALVGAGAVYVFDGLAGALGVPRPAAATAVVVIVAVFGELALTAWLVVQGRRTAAAARDATPAVVAEAPTRARRGQA